MVPSDSPTQLLRESGLRITAPRVMVLRVLADRPHAAADAIIEAVRAELGAVSTQGVYDVLRVCSDAGIVRRIQPAGGPARYELRVGDNHHHLVCRRCGVGQRHRLRGRRGAVPRTLRPPRLRRRRGRGRVLGRLPRLPGD